VTLWALSTDNLARPVADVADILEVIEAKMAEWIQGGLAQRLGMRIRPIGLLVRKNKNEDPRRTERREAM